MLLMVDEVIQRITTTVKIQDKFKDSLTPEEQLLWPIL